MSWNKQCRGYIDDDILAGFIVTAVIIVVVVALITMIFIHDKHVQRQEAIKQAYVVQQGELRVTDVRCERSQSVVRGDEFECIIEVRAAEPGDALNAQVIYVGDTGDPVTVGIYHPGDVE